jgi:hypothetical protein
MRTRELSNQYNGQRIFCVVRPKTTSTLLSNLRNENEKQNLMIPVSEDGFISLFPSLKDARDNAGSLGVPAAVNGEQLKEIAERHGLKVRDF